jgi:plastocyanin
MCVVLAWVTGGSVALALVLPSHGRAETVKVSMKDRAFTPQLVQVKVGDTVEWINDDTELHQVISGETPYDRKLGQPVNSGLMMWNGSFVFTFTKPGAYPYMCVIHRSLDEQQGFRGMVGTIVVSGAHPGGQQ